MCVSVTFISGFLFCKGLILRRTPVGAWSSAIPQGFDGTAQKWFSSVEASMILCCFYFRKQSV